MSKYDVCRFCIIKNGNSKSRKGWNRYLSFRCHEKFAKLGAKIIYIHPETDPHACRTLQMIKDAGAKAGIAINPGTSFETVKDLLHLCDYVMLMSVNPGFAGQKYLDFVTPKFKKFVEEAKNYGGYDVMIDGACSPEKIEMLSKGNDL